MGTNEGGIIMSYKLADVIWNDDGTMANEDYIALYRGIPVYDSLKALEIIKEKIDDIGWFKCCSSLEDYNGSVPSRKHLTQEEYDLLKKVLHS